MKKASKTSKTVMSGGMFMNSGSSNESNSDDERCHLPTADLIFSENEKDDEEQTVVIRRNTSKLKRQRATISLQSPLSVRNTPSLESVEHDFYDDDDGDVIVSDQMTIKKNDQDIHRTSFNESERTDSGIGRNSGSSWRLSNLSESFHYCPSQQQQDSLQTNEKQQGIYMLFISNSSFDSKKKYLKQFFAQMTSMHIISSPPMKVTYLQ